MSYAGSEDYLEGFAAGKARVAEHMTGALADARLDDAGRAGLAEAAAALDDWLSDPRRGLPYKAWRAGAHGIDARDAASRQGRKLGWVHALTRASTILDYAADDFAAQGSAATSVVLREAAVGITEEWSERSIMARQAALGEIEGEIAVTETAGASARAVVRGDDGAEKILRAAGAPAVALAALPKGTRAKFLVRFTPRSLQLVDVKAVPDRRREFAREA